MDGFETKEKPKHELEKKTFLLFLSNIFQEFYRSKRECMKTKKSYLLLSTTGHVLYFLQNLLTAVLTDFKVNLSQEEKNLN